MEEWSPTGLRIEIDYLPGKDAVWSDDPVPELVEPQVLSIFRVRVLQRVARDTYRVASIEDVETEKVFQSPDAARRYADELLEQVDAPIVDLLPEQFRDRRA